MGQDGVSPPLHGRSPVRAAASILVSAGLVVALAGCTAGGGGGEGAADADCAAAPSGSVSEGVDVTGEFGAKPNIVFASPVEVESTERSVVIDGEGETARDGDTVNVNFSILNGATGDELTTTEWGEEATASFPLDTEQFIAGVVDTLVCSTVGSRVVGVIPPAEAFGEAGSAQLGVEPNQSIVFVADVVSIEAPAEPPLERADGEDQPAQEGFPTVVLDDTGRPTVTIPDSAPPAELALAVLKQGDGDVVQAGDDVVVHYVGMNWTSKEVFDESWARGEPATFNTAQVIEGFSAAIIGQNVGSQVVVIIPPALGYGEGTEPQQGTITFVIDILGIA
jgi:peptidylprolyl isomerase